MSCLDQAVNIFIFIFQIGFSFFFEKKSILDYTKMDFPKLDSGSELMSFLDQAVKIVFV